MQIALFSAKPYDREFFAAAAEGSPHEVRFVEATLSADTAPLAEGADAVCIFVNDRCDAAAANALADLGVKAIALRCAGFNNVDLDAAQDRGLAVVRVPAYSPHAVAEHTLGLILCLNRRIHRAYNRVREHNFALSGLLGFDLYGKTCGVVGTGAIGTCVVQILRGFGCRVLAVDPKQNPDALAAGAEYVDLPRLLAESDVITLNCPLNDATLRLIDADALAAMKPGVMLVNVSRGAVVDHAAVLAGLKSGKIGSLALDVYEEEEVFFRDVSDETLADDQLARLLTFPNVLVTGHQAFFTREALTAIAETTLANLSDVEAGRDCPNRVSK
ncbi:2-hydroxyacid dehydrogenase [Alienimonas californiensis]|uniref:2-hydroxyacid dehydrogenase n=1 Tax=Alienimonas californiensis TaxID=2527989 RepID=UPI00119DAE2A